MTDTELNVIKGLAGCVLVNPDRTNDEFELANAVIALAERLEISNECLLQMQNAALDLTVKLKNFEEHHESVCDDREIIWHQRDELKTEVEYWERERGVYRNLAHDKIIEADALKSEIAVLKLELKEEKSTVKALLEAMGPT